MILTSICLFQSTDCQVQFGNAESSTFTKSISFDTLQSMHTSNIVKSIHESNEIVAIPSIALLQHVNSPGMRSQGSIPNVPFAQEKNRMTLLKKSRRGSLNPSNFTTWSPQQNISHSVSSTFK